MKTTIKTISTLIMAFIVIQIMTGCAAKRSTYGDSRTGYQLEYRMPKGMPMQYDIVSEFVSNMQVMGQEFDVESNSRNLFTLSPNGLDNGNLQYRVTIDSAYIFLSTPQGEMIPDMSQVIGGEFLFNVSPKGREMDCSGARELIYSMGQYEELSLFSDFKTLFPDLPTKRIKPGETWSNVDTLVEESKSGYMEFITLNEHVIEAAESCQGYDCLKIQTTLSGSIQGEGDLQGAKTVTSGTLTGNYTWYFAYKEGIFVKVIAQGKAENTTVATGEGREIKIPSVRDYSTSTTLVMN
jgi:hypothetical protein